jgi:hypothetical protein
MRRTATAIMIRDRSETQTQSAWRIRSPEARKADRRAWPIASAGSRAGSIRRHHTAPGRRLALAVSETPEKAGSWKAGRGPEDVRKNDQRIPNVGVADKCFRQRWRLHRSPRFSSIQIEKVSTFDNYPRGRKGHRGGLWQLEKQGAWTSSNGSLAVVGPGCNWG